MKKKTLREIINENKQDLNGTLTKCIVGVLTGEIYKETQFEIDELDEFDLDMTYSADEWGIENNGELWIISDYKYESGEAR